MRTLKVTAGPAAGASREIDQDVLIGREDSDLTIADPEMSRRHTLVRPVDEGVVVQDLGSLNGTWVNGERVDQPITLTSSGTIRVGESEIEVDVEVASPTVVSPDRILQRAQHTVPAERLPVPVADGRPRPPAPAPGRPVQPPATPPRARSRLRWALPLAALAVAGAVAAALVFVLGGDDEAQERTLRSDLTTALLKQTPTRVTFGGTTNQSPGGQGLVVGQLRLNGDLTKGKPVPLTSTMTFRFEGGRIDATVKGQAIPQPNKTVNLVGTGTIDGGSGDFEGAKGSFTFRSGQEPQNPTIGHPKIRGTIEF